MIRFLGLDISRFVWFCAAGKAFFLGAGFLIIVLVLGGSRKHLSVLISHILLATAIILIILSATPIPLWFYALWAVSVFGSFFVPAYKITAKRATSVAAIVLCVVAILIELPFHFQPNLKKGRFDCVYVIGDSISAGIGAKDEKPWPDIFRDEYGVEVINLSQAGAIVASAVSQTQQLDRPDAIVFIEIGGNDLFERTPYKLFEEALSQILQKAAESGRLVVMLELPLRPRDIQYGRIQRQLAWKYGAALVPKHFFTRIFAAKGATIDLVHLSPAGHRLMAERVWNLLKNSLESQK